MAGWAGFSEDELRRLKVQQELPHSVDRPKRQHTATTSRLQIQRRKALQLQSEQLAKQNGSMSTPSDILLSKPTVMPSSATVAVPCSPKEMQALANQLDIGSLESGTSNSVSLEISTEQDGHITTKEMELKEKPRLGQLQLEQRLIEEKNKRKKALLAKAIAERSKKTQAETVKLKRIQKQLQALDDLVSTDIGILRNRIDQACVEFTQAKKRYDKAENEYILAKLDLHKKTEIKEQLTEHLCTIIQENEVRKAKHLEELMLQLDVEADEEKLELEIEVDQMLQHQVAEARKHLVARQREQEQTSSPVQENNQLSLDQCSHGTEAEIHNTLDLLSSCPELSDVYHLDRGFESVGISKQQAKELYDLPAKMSKIVTETISVRCSRNNVRKINSSVSTERQDRIKKWKCAERRGVSQTRFARRGFLKCTLSSSRCLS
ncbi:RAB6-interacting golgin [Pelodytes ibericus]